MKSTNLGGRRPGAGRKVDTFRTLVLLLYCKVYNVGLIRARVILREDRAEIRELRTLASGPDAQKILRERMDEYCERRADAGFKDEPCVAKWIKARDEAEKAEQAKLEAEQRAEVAAFEKTKRLYWENFESEQKERNPIFSLDWAEANGLIKEQVDQFKREQARRWT